MEKIKVLAVTIITASIIGVIFSSSASAAQYVFPVIGGSSYSNDYNSDRGSEKHHAIDIIASKHQPIVSATDGVIKHVFYPQPSWGYAVTILSPGGYCYWYIHMNNDDRGTDNGKGGAMKAYAPDMYPGNPVKKGQLLGWVGDSGNSENTVSHLHFEVVKAENGDRCSGTDGTSVNPYTSLKSAQRISKPVGYKLPNETLPFGSKYRGGVNISRGNIDSDIEQETIIAAGYYGGPRVNVYDADTQLISTFYAFDKNLRYGTDVAAGDFFDESGNQGKDGVDEIVAAARTATGARLAIFQKQESGTSFIKLKEFPVLGGKKTVPRVAVGDIDGNGIDEVLVASGRGSVSRVDVIDSNGDLIKTVQPYASAFTGGVDITSGDLTGDVSAEIVVSPLTEGSSRIQILNGADLAKIGEFYAYGSKFRGGVWLSVGNAMGDEQNEIVTVPNGGGPTVNVFNGQGIRLKSERYMEEWWRGYYDVAAGEGGYSVATGKNRRASVR